MIDILLGETTRWSLPRACRRLPGPPAPAKRFFWGVAGAIGVRIALIFCPPALALPISNWSAPRSWSDRRQTSAPEMTTVTPTWQPATSLGAIRTVVPRRCRHEPRQVDCRCGAAKGRHRPGGLRHPDQRAHHRLGNRFVLRLMDRFPRGHHPRRRAPGLDRWRDGHHRPCHARSSSPTQCRVNRPVCRCSYRRPARGPGLTGGLARLPARHPRTGRNLDAPSVRL